MNILKKDYDFVSLLGKDVQILTMQSDGWGKKFPIEFTGRIAESPLPNQIIILQLIHSKLIWPRPKLNIKGLNDDNETYPNTWTIDVETIKSIKILTVENEFKFL